MDDGSRKFTIIGIAVILLIMAVSGAVGVVKIYNKANEREEHKVTTSNKAVESLCQHTDYRKSCRKSLANANDTDEPQELMKIAFSSAINEIEHAINKSSTLQAVAKDPRATQALEMCKSLLTTSIDDLKRSLKKLDNFDISKMEEYLADLKVWLSGSLTYQETCLEGFTNTTGDVGEKMKKILKLGGKLTSNSLAMVNSVDEYLGEVQLTSMGSRRLLDKGLNDDHHAYAWWTKGYKRLLIDVDWKALKPNVIVAQDGSGTFKTIMEAIKKVPNNNTQPFIIRIKQGVYKEYVDIPRLVNNVIFIGEGHNRTRIIGNKSYDEGEATFYTATVAVNGDGFMAKGIGFENTAGPMKHQAVALRISGDMAIIHNCAMYGYQDTLYAHAYRQFYRQCTITGTVDFVFGNAAAVFQDCKMIVRKPSLNNECVVTAQGRKDRSSQGGLILQNCTITGDHDYLATNPRPITYLGRPWKLYSRTIIMQSFIDGIIAPQGWAPWAGTFGLDTCYYGEFNNRGPGSNTTHRVRWKGIKKITPEEAARYTPGKYIQGDLWIKATGVPYTSGMMNV
ncbi:pectinesterase [Lactuca sativa]|uniref:pectinesterase n=1 Tax=Lactuca sativa TaxID=4236 RepID=UPI000CC33553|nr:pectinesterase [Lactuca sativa]